MLPLESGSNVVAVLCTRVWDNQEPQFGAESGRKSMLKPRRVVALLWSMSAFYAWLASAQDLILRPSSPTELKLVQIGHGKTKSGVKTAFRVYEAPDGSRGKVFYVKYDSLRGFARRD
jgi:hypothetical protein